MVTDSESRESIEHYINEFINEANKTDTDFINVIKDSGDKDIIIFLALTHQLLKSEVDVSLLEEGLSAFSETQSGLYWRAWASFLWHVGTGFQLSVEARDATYQCVRRNLAVYPHAYFLYIMLIFDGYKIEDLPTRDFLNISDYGNIIDLFYHILEDNVNKYKFFVNKIINCILIKEEVRAKIIKWLEKEYESGNIHYLLKFNTIIENMFKFRESCAPFVFDEYVKNFVGEKYPDIILLMIMLDFCNNIYSFYSPDLYRENVSTLKHSNLDDRGSVSDIKELFIKMADFIGKYGKEYRLKINHKYNCFNISNLNVMDYFILIRTGSFHKLFDIIEKGISNGNPNSLTALFDFLYITRNFNPPDGDRLKDEGFEDIDKKLSEDEPLFKKCNKIEDNILKCKELIESERDLFAVEYLIYALAFININKNHENKFVAHRCIKISEKIKEIYKTKDIEEILDRLEEAGFGNHVQLYHHLTASGKLSSPGGGPFISQFMLLSIYYLLDSKYYRQPYKNKTVEEVEASGGLHPTWWPEQETCYYVLSLNKEISWLVFSEFFRIKGRKFDGQDIDIENIRNDALIHLSSKNDIIESLSEKFYYIKSSMREDIVKLAAFHDLKLGLSSVCKVLALPYYGFSIEKVSSYKAYEPKMEAILLIPLIARFSPYYYSYIRTLLMENNIIKTKSEKFKLLVDAICELSGTHSMDKGMGLSSALEDIYLRFRQGQMEKVRYN